MYSKKQFLNLTLALSLLTAPMLKLKAESSEEAMLAGAIVATISPLGVIVAGAAISKGSLTSPMEVPAMMLLTPSFAIGQAIQGRYLQTAPQMYLGYGASFALSYLGIIMMFDGFSNSWSSRTSTGSSAKMFGGLGLMIVGGALGLGTRIYEISDAWIAYANHSSSSEIAKKTTPEFSGQLLPMIGETGLSFILSGSF